MWLNAGRVDRVDRLAARARAAKRCLATNSAFLNLLREVKMLSGDIPTERSYIGIVYLSLAFVKQTSQCCSSYCFAIGCYSSVIPHGVCCECDVEP